MELLFNDITLGIFTIFILIYSAILHEIAHGYVAERLGDPTARILGRLTLNPRPHIDLFLSILVPLMLYLSHLPVFGGAKPVPVDPFNFKEPRKDFALVSLAGPVTNIVIAIISTFLIKVFFGGTLITTGTTFPDFLHTLLAIAVTLNIYLAIFNLLPIPPLDGSKVFSLLLPEQTASKYLSLGNVGFFLLYVLLFLPIGGFSLLAVIMELFTFTLKLLGF